MKTRHWILAAALLPLGCSTPAPSSPGTSSDGSELQSVVAQSNADHTTAVKCFEDFKACAEKAGTDITALGQCALALEQCLPTRPDHDGHGCGCHGDGGHHGGGPGHHGGGPGHHGGGPGHHGGPGCHHDGGVTPPRPHCDGGMRPPFPHHDHDMWPPHAAVTTCSDEADEAETCDDDDSVGIDDDFCGPHPIGVGGPAAQMCRDTLHACLANKANDRQTCIKQLHTCVHDAIAANFKKYCDDLVKACEACGEPQATCDALAAKCAAGVPFPDHP